LAIRLSATGAVNGYRLGSGHPRGYRLSDRSPEPMAQRIADSQPIAQPKAASRADDRSPTSLRSPCRRPIADSLPRRTIASSDDALADAPASPRHDVITALGRTTLLVRNYDDAVAFYRDQLGFVVLHDDTAETGQRYLHIGVPGQAGDPPVGLWLLLASERDSAVVGRQAGDQPFLVLYTEDCVATIARLENTGVVIRRPPVTSGGATFAHIADLYGNVVVIVQLHPEPAARPVDVPDAARSEPKQSAPPAQFASFAPTAIRNEFPVSPFVRLHATGLLVQSFAAGVMLLVLARFVPGLTDRATTDPAAFALFYVGMGAVLLARIRQARVNATRLFGPAPSGAMLRLATVAVPLGVLSLAGFWILFLPLSYAAPDFVRTWAIEGAMRHPTDTIQVWIGQTIVAVVIAPGVEEVLFRGVLMHRWALKWGTRTGVLLSSALFAVCHVELLGHFLFGLAMSVLYLRTRSLWVPIAAHAMNNFLVSALQLPGIFRPEKTEERMTLATFQSQWWVGVLVLLTGAVLLEAYRRRFWKGIDLAGLINGPVPYAQAIDLVA
jgi:uncharacterized protein